MARTSPRVDAGRSSSRFRAPCGCCSPTWRQAASARSRSRPGSTTSPCGARAMTASRSAVAGRRAGRAGGDQRLARRLGAPSLGQRPQQAQRRSAGRPSGRARPGARPRRSPPTGNRPRRSSARPGRPRPAGPGLGVQRSSICSAVEEAAEGVGQLQRRGRVRLAPEPAVLDDQPRQLEPAPQGEMAGGRSSASSPGSNGGSPSSRSPSARICGAAAPARRRDLEEGLGQGARAARGWGPAPPRRPGPPAPRRSGSMQAAARSLQERPVGGDGEPARPARGERIGAAPFGCQVHTSAHSAPPTPFALPPLGGSVAAGDEGPDARAAPLVAGVFCGPGSPLSRGELR